MTRQTLNFVKTWRHIALIITKIEVQKKNKERANIYVDDNFFCGLSVENIIKNHLKEGKQIEEDFLNVIKTQAEFDIAMNKALKYISKTQKTKKQVLDYLIKKGFEEELSNNVVDKLIEYKYVDDEVFVKNFIKYKTKSNGNRKIALELKQKGVSQDLIEEAVLSYCEDKKNIFSVLDKYMKFKQFDLKTKQRAYRFLAGKGYNTDDIISCLNNYFKLED